jgi:nitrous oxidase accessory protein
MAASAPRGAALAALLWVSAALATGAERPADCIAVSPGSALQEAVDSAPEGGHLCLEPGVYRGPVRVSRRLLIWGPSDAVIQAQGDGTTVRLEGDGSALVGVTVDGSGGRFDLLDAAVRVEADDARVEGVTVRKALFGLLVEKSNRIVLRDNLVVGSPEKPLGMRGDGIRLWEVRGSRIERNRMLDSRDLVVWYSPGNVFVDNTILRGRYGTHFMYSHQNRVEGSRYESNVVGIFVMYSRDIELRDNLIAMSAGAAGVGLGAKESGNLTVTDNLFIGNTVGVYLDTSPLDLGNWNRFERNAFRLGDTGILFHGTVERNAFVDNSFRDNQRQVAVEGRGDAMDAEWRQNDFDDYAGYDLDGDGFGDVPYELRSLSEQLVARHPSLAFFRGSPAMGLVTLIGRVVPLFRAQTLLVDPQPRMAPLPLPGPRAG